MTDDQLTALLAQHVMGWTISPDRFMMGGRHWQPRWRLQPAKNLEHAIRLLEHSAPQGYSMGADEQGTFWARVVISGVVGEARECSQARAVTFALARAIGIEA